MSRDDCVDCGGDLNDDDDHCTECTACLVAVPGHVGTQHDEDCTRHDPEHCTECAIARLQKSTERTRDEQ